MSIDPSTIKPGGNQLPDRFWRKVCITPSGCWQWTAGLFPNGYGRFWFDGRGHLAHRWAYRALVGEIPDGLSLDHLCRNRACVNPSHLDPVTTRDNILRGSGLAAINAKKAHCPSGHEYTERNTRVKRLASGLSERVCRICQIESSRRYEKKSRNRARSAA